MRLPVVDNLYRPMGNFENGPKSIAAVRVLRISVTDRCNLRCVYCMPEEGVRWLPKDNLLTFEEICDVVNAAVSIHGIRRFKLTGGEPTVRSGLVDLVRMIRQNPQVEDLSLTTNGMLLEELAKPLHHAGLDRLTISIDSLRPDRFIRITRTGELSKVWRGLDQAESVGFKSMKINCVTMRGTNDDELVDFARLSLDRAVTVRFIEYMPLGDAAIMHQSTDLRVSDDEIGPAGGCGAQDRGADSFIAESEVRQRIEDHFGPLIPVDRNLEAGVGPAIPYRIDNPRAKGRIAFISAMSAPFCSTCNRLRLTADGVLRSCLFEGGEVAVRRILRSESNPDRRRKTLAQAMVDCVALKPDVHSNHGNEQMSRLGG
ncbi:MAG: GTP 3',8-cyclase MoaA [Phycisphaerales bacterium]|nr:GTP 3',8-cyclase MoaA [Phycisphaerales bacterium]